MDGETRKRKVEVEEESEEEKIEKFFALIRSTREVHERITGRTLARAKGDGEKKKPPNDEKVNGWKPSFQPQDFMGDDARLKTINIHQGSLLPGPSNTKKKDENKEKEEFMVDTQMKIMNIDQKILLPGPSEKREEDEEKDKAGDGLDLDLKL